MLLSQTTFERLCELIQRMTGIVITVEREYLIRHRLEPIIIRRGLAGFDELLLRLTLGRDITLKEAVIDAITTQETSFFRDPEMFHALSSVVFPALVPTANAAAPCVRIWCPGASTGQEAYSLAITATEFAESRRLADPPTDHFAILATDISSSAIQKAQMGTYPARDVQRGLSRHRLSRFFQPHGALFRINPSVRQMVEFRRVNLMEPCDGLGRFQLICCRNVLIYFDEPTRKRLCHQFHRMLTDQGWLILGAAENLYGVCDGFQSQSFRNLLIYRKRPGR